MEKRKNLKSILFILSQLIPRKSELSESLVQKMSHIN